MLADAAIGKSAGDIFMIDSTYIKAHADACGVAVRTLAVQKGLNSKLHLVVDEYGIPASGTVTDCNQAPLLMEDLETEAFLADKAYDTNELLDMLKEADITTVIPLVKSRKEQRAYSHELYRARHLLKMFSVPSSAGGETLRATQSLPLPSSPPFMSLYLPIYTV